MRVSGNKTIQNFQTSEILSIQNIRSTVWNLEAAQKLLVSFMLSFMERTLVETLLDKHNGLIEVGFELCSLTL